MRFDFDGEQVSIGAVALGEVWRTAPMLSPKRETGWNAECFTCNWMIYERETRLAAAKELERHIRDRHRSLVARWLLREAVVDQPASL